MITAKGDLCRSCSCTSEFFPLGFLSHSIYCAGRRVAKKSSGTATYSASSFPSHFDQQTFTNTNSLQHPSDKGIFPEPKTPYERNPEVAVFLPAMARVDDFNDRIHETVAKNEPYHPYEYNEEHNESWAGALPVKQ